MGQNKGGSFLEYLISALPVGPEVLYPTYPSILLLPPQLGSVLLCPSYLLSSIRDSESLCFYPLSVYGLMGQSLSPLTLSPQTVIPVKQDLVYPCSL